jgi:SAM-dependent methyltransferase
MNINFLPEDTEDTTESIVAASEYDEATREGQWDSPERAQKLVEQYVTDGSTVLDIGIGTGQAVKGYTEKGAAVVGLDHDPAMLEAAQRVTGDAGYMMTADINGHLPLDDMQGKIDVAQAIGVLEFAEDLDSVFKQVKAALKPSGEFVFTVETTGQNQPDEEQLNETDITVRRRSADEVRTLLQENGFTLQHDEQYGGYIRGDTDEDKVPYHIFLAQNQPATTE